MLKKIKAQNEEFLARESLEHLIMTQSLSFINWEKALSIKESLFQGSHQI
jgi:hypothetical protein